MITKQKQQKQKIVVIVGPTAIGKSSLAVELARLFDGEIVSADSRQIYRSLDIGTGKVTAREMRGVRHHLLDVASPRKQWSVAQYVRHADRAIRSIVRHGKLPIVVGGTGFYIDALLGDTLLPDVPANPTLRRALRKQSPRELLLELARLDPAHAQTIEPLNPRRLIRAIEIAHALGTVPKIQSREKYDALVIGLTLPDPELRERIRARLKARLRRGLIAEIRRLREKGKLSWQRLDALGLEYRYVSRHLRGAITRDELEQTLEQKIWQYARRQKTWFKRNKKIRWFRPDEYKKISMCVKRGGTISNTSSTSTKIKGVSG